MESNKRRARKVFILSRYIGYESWSTKKKTCLVFTMSFTTILLLTTVAVVLGSDTYFDTSGRNLVCILFLIHYNYIATVKKSNIGENTV